jgi:hypothetical protein
MRAQNLVRRERRCAMNAAKNPDPCCPKCGYTMCQLFDYRTATPLALSATPNGKWQCYHCTPLRSQFSDSEHLDGRG